MNRYSSYKNSGVELFGEIPKNWDVVRLKYLCDIGTGNRDTINKEEDGEFPFFVRSKTVEKISSYSYDCEAILTAGDGDICKIWHYINGKFDCHQRVYKLNNFRRINGKFLYYFLMENFEKEVFKLSAKSTVDSLRRPMFENFNVCLPEVKIQEQIVAYLDKKTAIVDTLITSKEEKIILLKENRTAIINHTITKGLDPNVKLKDSGVEWIGQIPAHWEMKKMKYLFQIQKRISGELGYDVLSITQKGVKIKDIESGKGQVSMDYTKYQIVEIGDFAMNHMDLLTGFIDISPFKGVTSPDYRVFTKTDEKINCKFYLSLFQFGYTNKVFYGFGQGSSMFGRWRLPSSEFNNFKLPYPSLEEQNQIVKYLDNKFQEIDETIFLEQKKIETLKEYRQALISEVVTGKIKIVKD